MKQYPFLKHSAAKYVFGIYLLVLLFMSRDTLFSSCLLGFTKSQILMLGWILLLGMAFLWVNRRNISGILKDPRVPFMMVSALILLIPMVVKRDWQLMYFSMLLCILFAVFVTYFITLRELARFYVVILTVLGAYSIFATYGLRHLAHSGLLTPSVFYNSNDWEFFDFVFTYAVTSPFWHRNFGIFREPGVYQFFVLLAVYLNNDAVSWDRQWKLWLCNVVLAFTMLTTFAIGGFAELGLLILFLFFDKKWYRETWGRIAAAAAVAVVAGIVGYFCYRIRRPDFANSIFYEFYDMFIRLTTDSESMLDRKAAIAANLQFFFRNPLVGEEIAGVLHGTNHNTSSTMLLFAILGIAGGALHVASWIALLWKRERNLFGNLVLLVILFMSFNTQNLVANVFFWLFPMMALVERGLPLLKRSK